MLYKGAHKCAVSLANHLRAVADAFRPLTLLRISFLGDFSLMWRAKKPEKPKFGNSSISVRKVIITSIL